MLAGHLSNQDEDEVEEELASLRQQGYGPVVLPNAPTTTLPEGQAAAAEEESGQMTEEGTNSRRKAKNAVPAS